MVGPAMGQGSLAKSGISRLGQDWANVSQPILALHAWASIGPMQLSQAWHLLGRARPGPILLSHALALHGWSSHGPMLQCQAW